MLRLVASKYLEEAVMHFYARNSGRPRTVVPERTAPTDFARADDRHDERSPLIETDDAGLASPRSGEL